MNGTSLLRISGRLLAPAVFTAVVWGCANESRDVLGPGSDRQSACDTTWVWETVRRTDTVCRSTLQVIGTAVVVDRGLKGGEIYDSRNSGNWTVSKFGSQLAEAVATASELEKCTIVLTAGIAEVVDTVFVECPSDSFIDRGNKGNLTTNVRSGRSSS